MKVAIKFPGWVVEESRDELPDYMPIKRKYIRRAIRSSPHAKHFLCKIIDAIYALRFYFL